MLHIYLVICVFFFILMTVGYVMYEEKGKRDLSSILLLLIISFIPGFNALGAFFGIVFIIDSLFRYLGKVRF